MTEHRIIATQLELREQPNEPLPTIRGYAVAWNARSVFLWGSYEQFAPRAFGDPIEGDIAALWSHDAASVLGRTRNGTLQISNDDTGVFFSITPPDTQAGRDAVALIRRGDVDSMSFGFNTLPEGETWTITDRNEPLRIVRAAQLVEVSPVAFPAYLATSAAVRAQPGEPVQIPAHILEQCRRQAATVTPPSTDDEQRRRASRQRLLQLGERS